MISMWDSNDGICLVSSPGLQKSVSTIGGTTCTDVGAKGLARKIRKCNILFEI